MSPPGGLPLEDVKYLHDAPMADLSGAEAIRLAKAGAGAPFLDDTDDDDDTEDDDDDEPPVPAAQGHRRHRCPWPTCRRLVTGPPSMYCPEHAA